MFYDHQTIGPDGPTTMASLAELKPLDSFAASAPTRQSRQGEGPPRYMQLLGRRPNGTQISRRAAEPDPIILPRSR